MNILECALEYRNKYNFSLIPLKRETKKPYISWKEYQERLSTEEEIKNWLGKWSNANIGIVTGKISGITVVDFDNPEALEYAERQGLPLTPLVKTGKGFHAYFRYEEGVGNFQKRDDLPDIDLRGDGGYVVAPPSIHKSGRQYTWVKGRTLYDIPLAPLPEWLLVRKPEDKTPIKDLYRGVSAGERNNALTRIAGSLVNDGLPLEECTKIAKAWNTLNKPPLPLKEVETTVKSIYEKHHREKQIKPDHSVEPVEPVEETQDKLFPVLEFPLGAFPDDLQNLMIKISHAFNVPVEAVASSMLPIISSAIGNSVRISVRKGWEEPPFIWFMLIGSSGCGKSPLISKLLEFIHGKQGVEFRCYEKEKSKYDKDMQEYKIIFEKIKKESKERGSVKLPSPPTAPKLTHYVASDTTIEALANIMTDSPRGVLLHNDELSGFVRSHDQYKNKGSDRQKYLELWNCNPWKIDRVGQGSRYIRDTGCAIVGGIQPLVMPDIFGAESFVDGLLPRFLIDIVNDSYDSVSDEELTDADMAIFERVLDRCYSIGIYRDEGGNVEHIKISFSDPAKKRFLEFQRDYKKKMRFLPPRAQVFIPKLISYAVRLSGILYVISKEDPLLIDENTLEEAIRLVDYYAGQAIKALKFYDNKNRLSEIKIELIKTLYELKDKVENARLKTGEIANHLNQKLPERIKQSNQDVSNLLRSLGLITKLSVGHSFLIWEDIKLKRLFFYIETSTCSTASTDSQIENELLG